VRTAPSTAFSASRLCGGLCSGTGRSQSRRACLPGSAPAIATAFAFAVLQGGHLVDVDAQVLAVGSDPLDRSRPGAHRRRVASGQARVADGGAEHPHRDLVGGHLELAGGAAGLAAASMGQRRLGPRGSCRPISRSPSPGRSRRQRACYLADQATVCVSTRARSTKPANWASRHSSSSERSSTRPASSESATSAPSYGPGQIIRPSPT